MRARLRDRRLGAGLAAVAALAAGARLPGVVGPVHDYDEGVYWESLRALGRGAPLYSAVYSSQPPAFLSGAEPAYALLGHSLVAGRLWVAALSLAGVVAGGLAMRSLAGGTAGLLAALLLALDPLQLAAGATLQADGPATSLALVAVALAAAAATTPRPDRARALAVGAGAVLAVAVLTKLLALPAALAVAVLVGSPRGRERARRLGLALLGALLGGAALLAPFADRLGPLLSQSVGLHLASHSVDEGGLGGAAPALGRELPLLALAALGTALAGRRHPMATAALLGWGLAAVAAMAAQKPLWPHHLVAVSAPLCLLGGLVASPSQLSRRRRLVPAAALGGAALLAVAVLGTRSAVDLRDDARQTAADTTVARLAAALPGGGSLVSDDPAAVARAGLDIPAALVDTSLVRIESGNLTAAEVEASATAEGVDGFYFGTTRLDHLAGLRDWVRLHFRRRLDLGEGDLYLRG